MPTIKDIARLAGVSQGTVSNVLNGKGIVSSEKILLVESAAATLGYVINEKAKVLRKGTSKILAIVLPNIRFKHYVDFFMSFKSRAESQGFTTLLFLSDDNPETERDIIVRARSAMATAVLSFASSASMHAEYRQAGFADSDLLFAERDQDAQCNYIGFDYALCGRSLAEVAIRARMDSVALVSDNLAFSHERQICSAFVETLGKTGTIMVSHVRTDMLRKNLSTLQLFDSGIPQGIFITNHGFAEAALDAIQMFYGQNNTKICTVSPLFTMPEGKFKKYELNYRLMGKKAAELLVGNAAGSRNPEKLILENSGFREWTPPSTARNTGQINFLTLDNPETGALKYLAHLYTRSTGIPVYISVASYDEIHEVFSGMDESSIYDVLRLDMTWLSWFAGRILRPLDEISPGIQSELGGFMKGLSLQYFTVKDRLFALPISPSTQILFYRKDLFESTSLKRLYQETFDAPLVPPASFKEYNRIAGFFTRTMNHRSPMAYGTTVTLGSTGVAGTEFLMRYFSHSKNLFDEKGHLLLDTEEARVSLDEFIETKRFSPEQYSPWWTHAAQEFAEGNVAMTILYSNFASEIPNRDSKVINRIGYAMVPGGSPILGGGSLGVSRFSKNPELALSFMQWLCSEPVSSASMLLGSVSACGASYENYEIIDTYPWLSLAKDCFALPSNRRTPYADYAPFDDRRFLGILGLEVKNAYNGAISSQEALAKAANSYRRQFGIKD